MIVTVIDITTKKEYQIEARSNGENAIKCPVCTDDRHKKNAKSMSFNGLKGTGNCHHCFAKFVEKGKGSERMVQEEKVYTRPVWSNVTALSDKLVQWFKNERGISQQTLIDLKVTEGPEWMPQTQKIQNCIHFNYFRDAELVNIKFRDGNKGFKLVSGAELILYNLDAIKGQQECILVEGEPDALSWHEVGEKLVVSVPNGATKGGKLEYMDNCWPYFDNMKVVYLGTDNDEAGRYLRDELARRIGKDKCKIIDYGKYKDANEVLVADPLLLPLLKQQAIDYPIEGVFQLKSLRKEIFDLKRNGLKRGDGISIAALNELITWVPGYVTAVTGVPNHGKGEVVDQVMVDLSHLHGWAWAIFSPENRPMALHVSKLASKVVGCSLKHMSDAQMDSFIDAYNDLFHFISPSDNFTLESIIEMAVILVRKYGIRGLLIDPWNKVDHQYSGDETAYISKCLDLLDVTAARYGIHIIVVAHPTKLQKDRETKKVEIPTPYNISGSAHWYNKMANCLCVYRNFYEDGSSDTEIHVQKVKFRHWGRQGKIPVAHDSESGRFFTVGYQNKESYLNKTTIQANLNFEQTIKNFHEPLIEQEDYSHLDPNDELPF